MAKRQEIPDILGQLRQPVNVLDDVLSGNPMGTWPKEVDYPIDRIIVGKRLRPVKDVTELAASMAESGLLQRIVLLPDGTLVVGGHRVAAAKLLGWKTIPARIAELDEVDAELAEIDENLYRRELTVLEQAEHLQRRMELLEIKGQRAKAGDNQHTEATTTAAVAETMGISERSAQQRLQIARGLTQEARDALRDTELAESTTKLLEIAKKPQQYQAEIVKKVLETNWSVDIAANSVMPHITSIEPYFDRKRYYARIEGTGHGVHATPACEDPDAVLAAFERGEYSYELHLSHLTRSYLGHYGGSDSIFDHKLREAEADDILAAWQWRTTEGDKARTACNKMASKLRRLGYEVADIEGWVAPAAPAAPAAPVRDLSYDAWCRQTDKRCTCDGMLFLSTHVEDKDAQGIIKSARVDCYCGTCNGTQTWKANQEQGWYLVRSTTAHPVPEPTAEEPPADEYESIAMVDDPAAAAAPAAAPTDTTSDAALDILAPDRKELSSAAQQRNARIDHVTAALTTALNALNEFEQLTGAYTLTPALRRAIEPMLTTLEGNRV